VSIFILFIYIFLNKVIRRWGNILKKDFVVDGVEFTALFPVNGQVIVDEPEDKLKEVVFRLSQTVRM
jgi:hypothetical protein